MRADVLKQIGDVARVTGDADRAIDAYRHAVSLDGDLAVARVELAALYEARGAAAEAETELEAALASVPTYVDAALQLAALRRSVARPAETVTLLVGVLHRDPWHLDALCSLGESLFQCGQREDARAAFARVLRFDPEHVGALYFDGVMLAEERRYDEAVERWARVVALEPAGEHARRARRDTRTAMDLQRIFAARERRAGEHHSLERRGAA
jgi:tetratricopeptide (TPR) repeat protein